MCTNEKTKYVILIKKYTNNLIKMQIKSCRTFCITKIQFYSSQGDYIKENYSYYCVCVCVRMCLLFLLLILHIIIKFIKFEPIICVIILYALIYKYSSRIY